MRKKTFSWMIRPKGFIRLLGAEYDLLRKAGGNVLFRFYIASVAIFIIALLTSLSVGYAMELLFHMLWIEIVLSLFISLLFVLIYIFLINTFTKQESQQRLFTLSNITRIGFVIFMAFIISKPIETYLFKHQLQSHVVSLKEQLVDEHSSKIGLLFNREIENLALQNQHYEQLNRHKGFDGEIQKLSQQMELMRQKKEQLIQSSQTRIYTADFFTYQIQVVASRYPLSWAICIVIIALFLLPGYLIYSISAQDDYFKLKSEQETTLITNAYRAFTEKYTSIFKKYGLELAFYSVYEDPPFNTKRKQPGKPLSADDFHYRYANRK